MNAKYSVLKHGECKIFSLEQGVYKIFSLEDGECKIFCLEHGECKIFCLEHGYCKIKNPTASVHWWYQHSVALDKKYCLKIFLKFLQKGYFSSF